MADRRPGHGGGDGGTQVDGQAPAVRLPPIAFTHLIRSRLLNPPVTWDARLPDLVVTEGLQNGCKPAALRQIFGKSPLLLSISI